MADETQVTREDEAQAQALEKALSGASREGVDVCGLWNMVKPFWPWIISAVKKIPRIGAIIARALELLGQVLDAYCKT